MHCLRGGVYLQYHNQCSDLHNMLNLCGGNYLRLSTLHCFSQHCLCRLQQLRSWNISISYLHANSEHCLHSVHRYLDLQHNCECSYLHSLH